MLITNTIEIVVREVVTSRGDTIEERYRNISRLIRASSLLNQQSHIQHHPTGEQVSKLSTEYSWLHMLKARACEAFAQPGRRSRLPPRASTTSTISSC